jgi:hypothetical protein
MAIRFSNGFGIGTSNNGGGGGSLSFFTNLGTIATYLRNYMSDFKNPNFYEYGLDGNGFFISDGGGDMYDSGNATSPWLISNQTYTGNTGYNPQNYPYAINYQTYTGNTGTMDTSFGYLSLGYSNPNFLPLTVLGTRATIASPGAPIGFQCGGNSGADGGGTVIEGNIYTGNTVSGFTVHSYYREIYNAGDPSTCDVYILLGHPSWNSVFGNVYYGGDLSGTAGNGSYLYTSGGGAQNILAIKTLLSKGGGDEVTFSEVNTVVDNFIMRIGETLSNSPTPTPTSTDGPLTQFTPNGTPGSNGLITYLDYTTGINASNLLPDQSGYYNEFAYAGANPYTNGVTGYTFTGSGSYAYAVSGTHYNAGYNEMSFQMWVKIPTIQSSMSLIAAGGNNSGGWALRLDGGGNQLNLVKYNVADQTVTLPYTLQADTWYHIAALQGGTSLTFMINGVIVGAVNDATTNNFSFPSGTINIAKDYYTSTNYAMSLGYLKVYDYCLLSADITTEFNNTKVGYGFVAPTPTPTPTSTPTDVPPTATPTETPTLYLNCYTVRQYLYGYDSGSNGDLYVLESDYPNVSTIPVGATATINGTLVTVSAIISSSSVYYQGAPGYDIYFTPYAGGIVAGTNVEFCWYSVNQPTPTPTSTAALFYGQITIGEGPEVCNNGCAECPTFYVTGDGATFCESNNFEANEFSSWSGYGYITYGGYVKTVNLDNTNVATYRDDCVACPTPTSTPTPTTTGPTATPSATPEPTATPSATPEMATLTIIVPPGTPSIIFDGDTYTSNVSVGVVKNQQYTINSSDGTSNFWYWSGTGINLPAANSQNTIVFVTGNTATLEVNYLNQPTGTPNPTATSTPSPTSTEAPTPTATAGSPTPTPSATAGAGVGEWYFYSDEGTINANPPTANGNTIFTINTGGPTTETFNPNKSGGVTFLHFNVRDSIGTDYTSQFSGYTGGTGTITISQNGDTATYTSTTPGSFFIETNVGVGGNPFFIIAANACTQTKSSNASFVYGDPISITFS